MFDQLLSKIEELERQEKYHWSQIGPAIFAIGQIVSQKAMLKEMINAEQQRQEEERRKQNEPPAAV